MSEAAQIHTFQAEVNQLLRLVIDSLYSNKEIFLRELVSNASDALDKLRFEGLTRPELLEGEARPEIRLSYDGEAGTLTIDDNGIGMSEEELVRNLGTIAHSGTRAFLEAAKQKGGGGGVELIGQFGVGFYSAFLVADRVEVVSRHAAPGSAAFRWSSDARGTFQVEPAERAGRGTSVVLHLKPDAREFLDDWRLRSLVTRYSDYVSAPILLKAEKGDGEKGDDEADENGGWQQLNRASALWQRSPSEVKPEQYDEFYRHLTHDFEPPLAHAHFRIEGTQMFSGIIYVPKRLPLDFTGEQKGAGLRLFVKRVFIMDDAAELLPPWLRFLRGVVDSDDLPLNVSREILQDSGVARVIKKQIVKKALDLLEDLAQNRPDDYKTFWAEFGPILKEGIALEASERERIADLARFASTKAEGLTGLSEYVTRMPIAQPAIYYAVGASAAALAGSPYLEALTKRGYEALLLSDPVDEWVVDALREYRGKPLTSAMRADLSLGGDEPEAAQPAADRSSLFARIKGLLGDKVREVRASKRLTDSPVCLVLPPGALPPAMERVLRASGRQVPPAARILEVNPSHPLVEHMAALAEREPESAKLGEWVELLYDQAVLLEGGTLEDPARFARRVNELLRDALATSAAPVAPH